jgi:hypothetical protein
MTQETTATNLEVAHYMLDDLLLLQGGHGASLHAAWASRQNKYSCCIGDLSA